jgi:hypothetical protein
MAYSPYQWKDGQQGGTPLTAARLNAIEAGIADAASDADAAQAGLDAKAPLTRAIPPGGGAGQFLVKSSSVDYSTTWQSAAGTAGTLPTGGTTGQQLVKTGSADYAAGWQTPSSSVAAHTHAESEVTSLVSDLQSLRTNLYGGSTRTKKPAAWCYMNADAAYSAATDTAFGSGMVKDYDSEGTMITLGSSQSVPTEITVPVAGMYLIEYHVQATAVTGAFYGRVVLNGTNANTVASRATTQSIATQEAAATPEATSMHLVFARALAAGDRLQFVFYATVAGTLKASYFGGAKQTRMGVHYLCPSS